jgi:hypothetical protein
MVRDFDRDSLLLVATNETSSLLSTGLFVLLRGPLIKSDDGKKTRTRLDPTTGS